MREKFCPECLDYTKCDLVTEKKTFTVKKDENIIIEAKYLTCQECGEYVPDKGLSRENYSKAYKEYRNRKGLLQPEEIVEIRNKYGLSQRQLAKILGWSHATLSRYESGDIQSVSHNNQLELIKDPCNLKKLVDNNIGLSDVDRETIGSKIGNVGVKQDFLTRIRALNFVPKRVLDVFTVAKYFLTKPDRGDGYGITPLKLQKICYYAQAWCLASKETRLFKGTFRAWRYGPVNSDLWGQYNGKRDIEYPDDYDPSYLTDEERHFLDLIWEGYGKFSAEHLRDLTHEDAPWKNARGNLPPGENSSAPISEEDMISFYRQHPDHPNV
ncbi:type II TA system antitoxin MqsA family protein [Numidum massiliense]|uniref:type II TA system antitoxin MqsA family protein n=1 Tax=Numidum massiliense TaxID=1522315 RepID=UPI0006D563F1|nr:type II TA system antitoxin MqsA family protein [Numidum massiliense]